MYAIHRVEKYKGGLFGLQKECQRTKEDRDKYDFARSEINWDETNRNVIVVKSDSFDKAFYQKAKETGVKVKPDSVKMIGALYTASQEFFSKNEKGQWVLGQKERDFFNDCLKFHVKEYCGGDPSRILSAVVHLDESTPHLQLYSDCFFKDEKNKWHLSAKAILGDRTAFHERQDRFWESVGKSRNMERGVPRSGSERRKHKETADYHIERRKADLKALEARKTVLEQSLDNLSQEIGKRFDRLTDVNNSIAEKESVLLKLYENMKDPIEQSLMAEFINEHGNFRDGKKVYFKDQFQRFKEEKIQMLEQEKEELFSHLEQHQNEALETYLDWDERTL